MNQLYVPQDTCGVVLAFLHWGDWRISRASGPAAATPQPWEKGREGVLAFFIDIYTMGVGGKAHRGHSSQELTTKTASGTWKASLLQAMSGMYKFLMVVFVSALSILPEGALKAAQRKSRQPTRGKRERDWMCLSKIECDLPARTDIHSSKKIDKLFLSTDDVCRCF